jgi:chemotaxis protein histidine kinase CheA
LQSDAEGNVLSPYSKFAEVLLGRATLAGAKLFDVLFKPAWEGMAIEEREKAMNVLNCLGFSEIQFDLAKDDLLSRVRLPAEGGLPEHQRVLGVRYEPIVHAGRLDGLLVILDDRTELEKLNAEKAKRRSKDAFLGECFCELRALDSSVRETVISDIQGFVADMARTSRAREVLNLFRAIHSVKGTARIAGLETLKSVAHAVESDFLTGRTSAGEVDWDRLLPKLLELSEIFAQYQKVNVGVDAIVTAENSRAADAPRVEGRKVAAWEQVFSQTVQKTALQVGKSVRFEFQCDSFSLSDARWRLLREALLHILNNAVDHGAEATLEERVKQGKPKETTVRLEIHRRDNGGVEVLVEDDGKGFDRDRILAKAVVQGLITRDVVCDLTEEATLALLLKPGFSTRDTATEVSGRGVGLDVVRQIVEQLGGYLSLSRRQPWGSRFKITLNGE